MTSSGLDENAAVKFRVGRFLWQSLGSAYGAHTTRSRPRPIKASRRSSIPSREDTSPSRTNRDEGQTSSLPATPEHGENSASIVIEAPQKLRRNKLDAHDFPEDGGSGGVEASRRENVRR